MLVWLKEPLRAEGVAIGAIAIALATAAYCLVYNALVGRAEPAWEALSWAVINVVPWWVAFEAAKRRGHLPARVGILAAALAASLLLQGLTSPDFQLGFELVRRLPAAALVAALLWLGRFLQEARHPGKGPSVASDLLVRGDINWVLAARNYVELHGGGRVVIARSSLASVEAQLAARGFIRIHRSILVRQDAIARVRTEDVVLHDGTSLKLGSRYRTRVRARDQKIRPFVPSD